MTAAEEALAHCHIQSPLSLYYQALDAGDFDRLEREGMEGDWAKSTSHLQAVSTPTMQILATGVAEAEHVRTPAGWRIRTYKVTERITDKDMLALKKTLGLDYQPS